MSDVIPISKTKHSGFGWLLSENYSFAAQDTTVPIVIDEISNVIPTLPMAFCKRTDQAEKIAYELVALLSPVAKRNLFVKPDGSWLTGYIPAKLRTYPFSLRTASETGQPIVCFDQASGLMTQTSSPDFKQFFTEDGKPSPVFSHVMTLMQQYEQRRVQTLTAVETLAEFDLLSPWNIVLENDAGRKRSVRGVFKVNAEALHKVGAESLGKLHQTGALAIAYAQLLSERRVQTFGELLKTHSELHKKELESVTLGNIDALFGNKSDMLNFDNF
jgi:hypothetical protein